MHDEASLRALLLVLSSGANGDTACAAIARAALADCAPRELALYRASGSDLVLVGSFGIPSHRRRWCAHLASDAPVPEQRVRRDGEPIALTSAELAELPVRRHLNCESPGVLVVAPVRWEGYVSGVLVLRSAELIEFDAPLQRRLDGIAAALALWLAHAPEPIVSDNPTPLISERQRHVLSGIRRGMTNAAIAAELGFAIGTIKADITAMSALFGASGRTDLLRRVDAAYA